MKQVFFLLVFTIGFILSGCKKTKEQAGDPGGETDPEKIQKDKEEELLPKGKPYTVEAIDMKMEWIPPGRFTMGSHPSEVGHHLEEETLHMVIHSQGFWMGAYEVNQKQFLQLMGENPSTFQDENMPAHKVDWHDALEFCEILTDQEKRDKRIPDNWKFNLPTEAQWEYACRADATTAYHFGNSVDDLARFCWFNDNSKGSPKPVGLKRPNDWGLYDIHGNVGEWCYDWYGKRYPPDRSVDPITEKGSEKKVFRGGTYTDIPERCRSAHRHKIEPDTRNPWIGFRVVLTNLY